MARPSSIDRMPDEIRERIGQLRDGGSTIDEILAALAELDGVEISRSALGRHIQNLDRLGVQMRRSRDVATALVGRLGTAEVGRNAQLNIELMHTAILDLFMKAQDGDGTDLSKGGQAFAKRDPMGIQLVAKALDHLAKASKTDAEYRAEVKKQVREELAAEAKENISKVAASQGLSAETAKAIMAGLITT
ncbi:Mu-like prophage FluMu protein [Gluconobacter thailandicus F149-1 = NBRC 100600]|uniref:Mu-like prophage FluMu protein gp27 n=1 Tax=Gluconobacter thailandicus NBRC 3257 TaxID=1381097 RepID=A0ABQ0IY62_GLUTH|nr:phage protein Gp27 family protein [Gluconobacter thailandicus]KXV54161.1 hypothetical protein AD946_04305 [Gluconobacter thailandicus]GAD26448.1 Mu-like prophage FluMu protein gp27 [Gluconobacter thailandicus NBRC 3257]GAN92985.1 Mu-like prophage FluMu protein [Gluconobacter thailandicus F149-1 = NBRC 100600]GBR61597.1 Mu-like prophage FluMu [Gluconobacter thailandicus F149-1 = NBRC 100600]GEL87466.1 hypothetical protein GTH01_18240 [Gluconobacter thailandicus F149-1 = NBRC 100600]